MVGAGEHGQGQGEKIDESLYSRQLYVMGHEAQKRMQASDVLIIGLGGLGIEVAKNVILAGVKSVTLFDPTPTTAVDLASQFYLSEKELGQARDKASAPKLAELNPYVPVHILEGGREGGRGLSEEEVTKFRVVCATNQPLAEQLRLNAVTHPAEIAFISSEIRGLCGNVFCDFGSKFLVTDPTDEPAVTAMIGSVTQEDPAVVSVLEEHRHGLETGDVVMITEVEGMTEVNNHEYKITVTGPSSFQIPLNTHASPPYLRGGYLQQIKQPLTLSFLPLSMALTSSPASDFVLADFAKMDRPLLLHL
ncbi:hypothetical protein VYU27_009068, partial [Nannochloropsis oceanica]